MPRSKTWRSLNIMRSQKSLLTKPCPPEPQPNTESPHVVDSDDAPNDRLPNPPLCNLCRNLLQKRDSLFHLDSSSDTLEERQLSDLSHTSRQGCTLCQIVLRMAELELSTPKADQIPKSMSIKKTSFLKHKDLRSSSTEQPWQAVCMQVADISSTTRPYPETDIPNIYAYQGLLVPTSLSNNSQQVVGRIIDRNLVDYASIRGWIATCTRAHSKCNKHRELALGHLLYFIDCAQSKIVKGNGGQPYLALSYVWGKDAKHPEYFPWRGEPLPRTIQDAVHVTSALGYRYLWVDQYCMDQYKTDEKAIFISMMDKIYEEAHLTIIDAHSDGADGGLPGAGTIPYISRQEQPHIQLEDTELVWTMPSLLSSTEEIKWLTRGWTYQEGLLSRRCLIFTKYQVHLLCKSTARCETLLDIPQDSQPCSAFQGDASGELTIENWFNHVRSDQKMHGAPSQTHLGSLARHASWFTKRSLSHDSDALNAITGILARADLVTYCGIPLIHSKDDENPENAEEPGQLTLGQSAFLRGLAWKAMGNTTTRRPSMPTWSWLSVRNAHIQFLQDPEEIASENHRNESCQLITKDHGVMVWYQEKCHRWSRFPPSVDEDTRLIPYDTSTLFLKTYTIQIHRCLRYEDFLSTLILEAELPGTSKPTIEVRASLDCRNVKLEQVLEHGPYPANWKLAFLNKFVTESENATSRDQGIMFLVVARTSRGTWQRIGVAQHDDFHMNTRHMSAAEMVME